MIISIISITIFSQVIKGLDRGLLKCVGHTNHITLSHSSRMCVGESRKLVVPADLGACMHVTGPPLTVPQPMVTAATRPRSLGTRRWCLRWSCSTLTARACPRPTRAANDVICPLLHAVHVLLLVVRNTIQATVHACSLVGALEAVEVAAGVARGLGQGAGQLCTPL